MRALSDVADRQPKVKRQLEADAMGEGETERGDLGVDARAPNSQFSLELEPPGLFSTAASHQPPPA